MLFIGDPDQLPAVGAGNVLKDMIASAVIPCFRLTQVFRQAQASFIIQYVHQIKQGQTPYIESPFKNPDLWHKKTDCMFIDSDEATQEQLGFITRVKRHFDWKNPELENLVADQSHQSPFEFRIEEAIKSAYEVDFVVPEKFKHVDIEQLTQTEAQVDALKAVVKKIHPWSSLHYGLSAIEPGFPGFSIDSAVNTDLVLFGFPNQDGIVLVSGILYVAFPVDHQVKITAFG